MLEVNGEYLSHGDQLRGKEEGERGKRKREKEKERERWRQRHGGGGGGDETRGKIKTILIFKPLNLCLCVIPERCHRSFQRRCC